MKPLSTYAFPLLRIALSLVFLYFGFQQITAPDVWVDFVPSFLTSTIITAANIVMVNGVLELTLGTFLLMGLYTRISALILSLHLFGITTSIGFTPLGVRDFGLAAATLVLFLQNVHPYSIDSFDIRRRTHTQKS